MTPLTLLISPPRLQVINLSCGLLVRLLDFSPGLRSEILGKSSPYHVKNHLIQFWPVLKSLFLLVWWLYIFLLILFGTCVFTRDISGTEPFFPHRMGWAVAVGLTSAKGCEGLGPIVLWDRGATWEGEEAVTCNKSITLEGWEVTALPPQRLCLLCAASGWVHRCAREQRS